VTESVQAMNTTVRFSLDGKAVAVEVATTERLIDTLRLRLGTAGIRESCGVGACGTCSVLRNGYVVSACLLLTVMLEGDDLVSAEGALGSSTHGAAVVQAFVDHRAYQCSFCTPAMALTAASLTCSEPIENVAHELAGNFCRCGSYPRVYGAVEKICGASRGNDDGVVNGQQPEETVAS
jgi:Aerobic-type carbon monoxide dehydrogenase, small subunit CoxS/CutS homologs